MQDDLNKSTKDNLVKQRAFHLSALSELPQGQSSLTQAGSSPTNQDKKQTAFSGHNFNNTQGSRNIAQSGLSQADIEAQLSKLGPGSKTQEVNPSANATIENNQVTDGAIGLTINLRSNQKFKYHSQGQTASFKSVPREQVSLVRINIKIMSFKYSFTTQTNNLQENTNTIQRQLWLRRSSHLSSSLSIRNLWSLDLKQRMIFFALKVMSKSIIYSKSQ